MQIIDVPGVGEVEFPDEMGDADIVAAVKRLSGPQTVPSHATAPTVPQPAGAPERSALGTLGGVGEAALALGTGAVAYPAGLAASGVNLLRGKGMDSARAQRTAVQEGLTYEPRSEEGRGVLSTVAGALEPWTKTAEYVGSKVGEATGSPTMGGITEEVWGGVVNPLSAVALGRGMLAPKLAAPVRPKPGLLRRTAESAAVRATNADRTAYRRAFKGNPEAVHEAGAFLLDENLPLRSPAKLRGAAQGIARDAGAEIGSLSKAADQSGAAVDLVAAVQAAKSSPAVSRLSKNTITRAKFDEITAMLDDQIATNGGKVPPSVAHDIRMQLDELANWDQSAPKGVIRAWRAAREAVDAQIDSTMTAAGMGEQWGRANSRFAQSRRLSNPKTNKGLADIGAERRAANRFGQPSEKAAALLGATTAAMGNPLMGVGLPIATAGLNRAFFPATARTLNAASRLSMPSLTPQAAAALARAMAGEPLGSLGIPSLRLRPAAAHDEEVP